VHNGLSTKADRLLTIVQATYGPPSSSAARALWTTGSVRSVFLKRSFSSVSIMFTNNESGRSVWSSLSSSMSGARSARLDSVSDCTICVPGMWMRFRSNSDR